jgi:CBS-domain-containing membrane protein
MIKIIHGIKELRELKVRDIMTEDVQTVGSHDPVERRCCR